MTRKKSPGKKAARALQRDTGITYTEALAVVRQSTGQATTRDPAGRSIEGQGIGDDCGPGH